MESKNTRETKEFCLFDFLWGFFITAVITAIPILIVIFGDQSTVFIFAFVGLILFLPAMVAPLVIAFISYYRSRFCFSYGALAVYLAVFVFVMGGREVSRYYAMKVHSELAAVNSKIEAASVAFKPGDEVILRKDGNDCSQLCQQLLVFAKAANVAIEDWGKLNGVNEKTKKTRGNLNQSLISYRFVESKECSLKEKRKQNWKINLAVLQKMGLNGGCLRRRLITMPVGAVWIIEVSPNDFGKSKLSNVRFYSTIKVLKIVKGTEQKVSMHQYGSVSVVNRNLKSLRASYQRIPFGLYWTENSPNHYKIFADMVGLSSDLLAKE